MAIKLPNSRERIKVIIKSDSAIKYDQKSYDEYLKTNDESLLTFVEGEHPTRFVMRKVLRYDQAQAVQNSQAKVIDGKVEVQISYMMEEVRQALVDVENPPGIPDSDKIEFSLDKDGAASKELIAGLAAIGAIPDLFAARNKTKDDLENVKKS